MRYRRLIGIGPTLFAATAIASAQDQGKLNHHRYKLIDIGTLGGPASEVNNGDDGSFAVGVLNTRGTVAGQADSPA
jgi:hypothetical protein